MSAQGDEAAVEHCALPPSLLQGQQESCADHSQAEAGPHSLDAWRRAWSLVHSRSFREGDGRHLIVPGVNMCNHMLQPTAAVRCASLSFDSDLPASLQSTALVDT